MNENEENAEAQSVDLILDLQQMIVSDSIPDKAILELWVKTALIEEAAYSRKLLDSEYELTIRIVDKDEIQQLNKTYRHKDKPTNVLSFPFAAPPEIQLPLLGDIIICHDVVIEEAQQQQKNSQDHWAHIVIHGVLHLKGYDHIQDSDADIMETLEIQILNKINISNPY